MYEFVQDLTSDVMFRVEASSLKGLFEDAAKALFELTCQVDKVDSSQEVRIQVKAESLEYLLKDFLGEIIAEIDIKSMFFSKIRIEGISDGQVDAVLCGSGISSELGETVAKAVANYGFSLKKDKGYTATIVIDI